MTELTESQLRALIRQEVGSRAAPPATAAGHGSIAELLACPECFSEVIKQIQSSEYECEDCGLPLGSEKLASSLKECPRCKSHSPRKVER